MTNFIKTMFSGQDAEEQQHHPKHKRQNFQNKVRFIDHCSKGSIKSEFSAAVSEMSTFKETLKSFIKDKNSEFASLTPAQQKTFMYVYDKIKSSNSFMRFLLVQVNKACNPKRCESAEALDYEDTPTDCDD